MHFVSFLDQVARAVPASTYLLYVQWGLHWKPERYLRGLRSSRRRHAPLWTSSVLPRWEAAAERVLLVRLVTLPRIRSVHPPPPALGKVKKVSTEGCRYCCSHHPSLTPRGQSIPRLTCEPSAPMSPDPMCPAGFMGSVLCR